MGLFCEIQYETTFSFLSFFLSFDAWDVWSPILKEIKKPGCSLGPLSISSWSTLHRLNGEDKAKNVLTFKTSCFFLLYLSTSHHRSHHHHHHHIVLAARISLTLSRHSSLSFIALGRSSGQQPVSSHSCWMYVRAGRPAFARPCVGIHKSTSLMSSSLLLQQCPACLVRLTWIVFVIGGRWPYSWCLVGCCCQEVVSDNATYSRISNPCCVQL